MVREILSVVTRKGQITLPAEIRRSLGIREGDKVAISLGDSEEAPVILRPMHSVAAATFGAVTPRKSPEDFQELRRLFEEGVAEEVRAETPPSEKP